MFDLMAHALSDREGSAGARQGYYYTFSGDLRQMSQQDDFLRERGFDVGRINVYPSVKTEEEFKRALRAIYEARCPGWWHYSSRYIQYGICTAAEFNRAMDIECEQSKRERDTEERK